MDGIDHYPLFVAHFADEFATDWDDSEFTAFNE